jgi:hypothetical protein
MFIFFFKANKKIIKFFKSETLISKKKFKDIERDSKPVLSNTGSVSFTNERFFKLIKQLKRKCCVEKCMSQLCFANGY